jgi:hypothetical protein
VRDLAMERVLTSLRAAILTNALADAPCDDSDLLEFCSALAQHCFINEYIFAVSDAETAAIETLKAALAYAANAATFHPLHVLAAAMYVALGELPEANALVERNWPTPPSGPSSRSKSSSRARSRRCVHRSRASPRLATA